MEPETETPFAAQQAKPTPTLTQFIWQDPAWIAEIDDTNLGEQD